MEKGRNLGHLTLIRNINRSLVLNTVKEKQPISRAQLSKTLHLSKTTVSAIVDELLDKRLLVEYGDCVPSTGAGRPSVMLGFNPRSAYCIGVDIGGTKILLLVTDLSGEVVYEVKVPAQSSVEGLVAMIASAWEACGVKREALLGIGVGVPGTVTKEGVVIRARALGWNNLPLQEMLEKQFGCPVFVGNDVNLAALGERWLGSGEQTDHMLFLTIGTGIGGALICGGQLVLGAQNRAGEIGYFLESCDVERGRLNRLGSQGVLEKKCSGSALNQAGRSAKEWFSAYRLGEQEAVARIGAFVRDLSVAIADAVSLLNPEKVVIGGGVSASMETVIGQIREEVAKMTPLPTEVVLAQLGERAGALGAVNFACTQIEQQELR